MHKHTKIVFFLFIAFFFLFLSLRSASLFQHDMVRLAAYAEHHVHEKPEPALAWHFRESSDGSTFPWRTGTYFLTAATYKLFHALGAQNAEFTTSFIQWILGAAALALLFLFLKELYTNNSAALLAAIIFGVSSPIFSSILAKESGGEYFFAFLAMYLLIKGVKQSNTLLLTLSSASLGLLYWMREGGIFFPLVYYGFFIVSSINIFPQISVNKKYYSIKYILILIVPFLIAFYLAYRIYIKSIFESSSANLSVPLFGFASFILNEFWTFYSIVFFMLILAGIVYAIKDREKYVVFFTVTGLTIAIAFTKSATFDLRHLGIYTLFSFTVLSCYAFKKIITSKKRWIVFSGFILAAVIAVQVFLPILQITLDRRAELYPTSFSQKIKEVTLPESIIFVPEDFRIIISYYAKRETLDITSEPAKKIETTITEGRPVYLLYQLSMAQLNESTRNQLSKNYVFTLIHEGKFENYHHADLKQKFFTEELIKLEPQIIPPRSYRNNVGEKINVLASTMHNNQTLLIEGNVYPLKGAPFENQEIVVFKQKYKDGLSIMPLAEFKANIK